ncbi:S1 family peptidase [Nonomuraea sp. NPDC049725]|uniref:S1 family peptidase n=1 Tax=Nonomuraea sp. NPDC049725 TaxID=3154508 RepID=UPI003419C593
MHLPAKRPRRVGLSIALATAALTLSSVSAPSAATAATATALTHASDITLAVEHQPKVPRPTLEKLKAEATAKNVPLIDVIKDYVDQKAKTDPAATANWPDGPVDTPDVLIDDLSAVQLLDLQGLAEADKITLEASIDRYGYYKYNTRVADQLAQTFPAELSGFATQDDGSAWIGFKGAIPPQAVEMAKTLPVRVQLRGNLGYAETDLPKAQEQLQKALQSRPDVSNVSTWYDPRTGLGALVVPSSRVKTAPSADTLQATAASAVSNPHIHVSVKLGKGPLFKNYDTYIRGGGNFEDCTTSFNLISESGNTKRLGTAGHCALDEGNERYRYYCNQSGDGGCGTTTERKWVHYGPGGDIAMYDHGPNGWVATRTFYWDVGSKRYADARSAGPKINDPVCKFGQKSKRDCGRVIALNQTVYDGDLGVVVGGQVLTTILNGSDTCTFGDSGGPFYRDAEAYGVLKGALVDEDNYLRCAFTPVNRYYNGAKYYVWTR